MQRRSLIALAVAAAAVPGVAWAQDPSFTLVNRTGRGIQEVYASAADRRDWGHDRLGSEVIPPGGTHAIRIAPGGTCVHDIRIVTDGGQSEERRRVDTCRERRVTFGQVPAGPTGDRLAGGRATPAPPSRRDDRAGNPSFNLLNRAAQPIREVYASPASRQDWGADLLGRAALPPGRSFAVRLPLGECDYDLRVVFGDGRAEERRGVNTCDLSTVPFP